MKTCIIIPARYASTRYPGKPLVQLTGKDGVSKSLILRSWEQARKINGIAKIVIATDDIRIKDHAESFGAEVIMTSTECANGTERCAEAATKLGEGFGLYINFQGDAPMTPHWFIESMIEKMKDAPEIEVATPVLQCDPQTYSHFRSDRSEGRVGGTTVVFNSNMKALYFSKEVIPYADLDTVANAHENCFHHVGVYAYRKTALLSYPLMKKSTLEEIEGLEQLRFLENGTTILCVKENSHGAVFWELNNPVDVKRIEEHI